MLTPIYCDAYVPHSEHHEPARRWLETIFSQPEPVGLSWATILAFLRISTTPEIFQYPFSLAEAVAIVSGWLEPPRGPTWSLAIGIGKIVRELLTKGQAHGPLVTDAHLAALAIEHGATLATSDRDFARFPGLRVLNPLEL